MGDFEASTCLLRRVVVARLRWCTGVLNADTANGANNVAQTMANATIVRGGDLLADAGIIALKRCLK